MLGFDEIRFEPVSFSYQPASYASSRVTVTTEGVGALPEGQLALHYQEAGITLDGGVQALDEARLGYFSDQLALPGEVNGVSRFRGFEQSALSGVTLLVPGQASNLGPSPGTGALSFGTQTLPVSTVAGYLLALRLPLE